MSKVTIGLLVYNEIAYVQETIENIRQQSFQDFEILVGDNASTDGTSELIAELAKQDQRIIHIKRTHNIGALPNWNDIIMRARGEYFVLAGGHDLWSRNYLEKLVERLDNCDKAALAFCRTQWIDAEGIDLSVPTRILDTSGMSSYGKFICLMFANQDYLYGMARISAMKKTRLQLDILGSGEIYLQELAQQGDFVLVENERWYRRRNRVAEDVLDKLVRYRNALFTDPWSRRKFKCFPFMQLLTHYLLLPFIFRSRPVAVRLWMLIAYPLIFAKYLPYVVLVDTRWLLK